jgi:hypothetical protein
VLGLLVSKSLVDGLRGSVVSWPAFLLISRFVVLAATPSVAFAPAPSGRRAFGVGVVVPASLKKL